MSRKKILVRGGGGQLGRSFCDIANDADYEIVCASKAQLDITELASIQQIFATLQPQIVINTAAYTDVDRTEQDRATAFAINRDGAKNLAHLCAQADIPLLHLSTDYVFDGKADTPYQEDALTAPVTATHMGTGDH